jgi:hypothetical protein
MAWSPTGIQTIGTGPGLPGEVSVSSEEPRSVAVTDQVRRIISGESPPQPVILSSSVTAKAEGVVFDQQSEGKSRRAATALATNPRFLLTVLAFVEAEGRVSVDALVEDENREELFKAVFDLYDADLLSRDGGTVLATDAGKSVLKRAGLL